MARQELLTAAGEERRLEELGRVAAGVAHDLTNSLTAISLRCAALAQSLGPDDPRAAQAEEIRHMAEASAERMRHVLGRCRDGDATPEPGELGAMVRAALPALRRVAGPHVELAVRMASPPLWVPVTQGAVEHVLVNLVSNAVHATGGDGRVEVSVVRRGPWAVLEVADDGAGMDEDLRLRAVRPFFTTRAAQGGSGLGLTAVADVVDCAGGRMEIRSAPGRGTTVSLRLPCA